MYPLIAFIIASSALFQTVLSAKRNCSSVLSKIINFASIYDDDDDEDVPKKIQQRYNWITLGWITILSILRRQASEFLYSYEKYFLPSLLQNQQETLY